MIIMEKYQKISVFWAKIQKNFLTQALISLTKYWNSEMVGTPENVQISTHLPIYWVTIR